MLRPITGMPDTDLQTALGGGAGQGIVVCRALDLKDSTYPRLGHPTGQGLPNRRELLVTDGPGSAEGLARRTSTGEAGQDTHHMLLGGVGRQQGGVTGWTEIDLGGCTTGTRRGL